MVFHILNNYQQVKLTQRQAFLAHRGGVLLLHDNSRVDVILDMQKELQNVKWNVTPNLASPKSSSCD